MSAPTLLFDQDDQELRHRARAWIADNDPGSPPRDYQERILALVDWQRELNRAGFVGVSWPVEFGGSGMGLSSEAVIAEELARSSMPQLINRLAVYTWGPTLLVQGTDEQKSEFLPGMLDASEIWCQGFSEPNAGSDLAAVATRAARDGSEFVVSGQKVWTSRAEISKWNALLVRTSKEERRHDGLTLLVVDMESDGVTIRPLPQLLNQPHFSEVFFDEVRVPLKNVLGGVGNGWLVAMAAMGFERGLFVLERAIGLRSRLEDLIKRLRQEGLLGQARLDIGRLHAKLEVLQSQVYRTLALQSSDALPPGWSSIDKLFLAEVYQDIFATAFKFLGHDSAFVSDEWADDLLESRGVSIYSGTDQIQRNVIARSLLKLR